MMNLYRPNRRPVRRGLVLATVLIAAILLVDILSHGAVRSVVRSASAGVWSVGTGISRRIGQSGFFSSRASLAAQNAALSAQLAQLQDASAALSAVQSENDQLRTLVHLASTMHGITAPVISSFRTSPYGSFSIGAGSTDNVQKGALVYTADGFIIGRATDVSAHTTLVSELFAPGASIDARIGSVPVVLSGHGGDVASAEASRAASISIGDTVFAPSLSQRPIGVVGDVQKSVASPSTKLLVRLPVNVESLSFVYVETGQ